MKKLRKLTFSKMLSREEQKQIVGGYADPIMRYACHCKCKDSVGEWDTYTTSGDCPKQESNNAWCASGYAECTSKK